MRTTLFCLGCGKLGAGSVPPRECCLDGTPAPGWCSAPACQEQRAQFDAAVDRILKELQRC